MRSDVNFTRLRLGMRSDAYWRVQNRKRKKSRLSERVSRVYYINFNV